ncbi:condensation domain-containing protein [Longispora urticae]
MSTVEFRGDRAGEDVLTWGQRAIWNAVMRTVPGDHFFNFGRILRLRTPVPVEAAHRAVAALVARHESLRTLFQDSAGEPRQRVAAWGTLDILELDDSEDPETVRDRLEDVTFDYPAEWPLRVAFLTKDGLVGTVVLVFCHLAADGNGADVVVRDLRLLLVRGALHTPVGRQPLDLAAEQQSPAGQQAGRAALAHWTTGLRRVPPTMFTDRRAEPRPRPYWCALLTSRAADHAARLLAARYGASSSTVLMTAAAALVGAVTGRPVCAMTPIVNNRFAAADRDMVSTLAQDGLFVLDLTTATFNELLRSGWQAALTSFRHARYDQVALDAAVAGISEERGEPVHPYCCFNDVRFADLAGFSGAPPTEAEVRAAMAESTVGWSKQLDQLVCRFCLHVEGEPGQLGVSLTADTAYLPPEAIEEYLWALERLLVEAAFRDVPLAELPAWVGR